MNPALGQTIIGIGGCSALVAVGVVLAMWGRRRCRTIVAEWAAANGYQLVQSEERYLRRGPFFWTTGRGQSVFWVTLRDGEGRTRDAWLRVGHWLIGTLSRQVAVKWSAELP